MPHKLFRDSLYDYIQIDKKHSWLLDLINTPEVQRLRHINQLGMSHITYPGSNHSRFSHSLGVLHLMQQCLSHLKRDYAKYFKQLDEEALLAVAVLHDIGHGPFSHATESIFGDHEERTHAIVNDPKSYVHAVLHKRAKSLPKKVAILIAKKSTAPLWQKSLISSQLDMDRIDYIRRDSLCSGAGYGNFDWFRILHTMELNEKKVEGRQKETFITWPIKSKFALEEYIFSRFYMYQSVYFHHTTRGFECLLRKILERATYMAAKTKRFCESLLPPMKVLIPGNTFKSTQEFVDLNDHAVMAQIAVWKNNKDKTLKTLAKWFLNRQGLGWKELPGNIAPMEMHAKITKIEEYLKSKGLDPEYYFFEDKPETLPYRPYRSASASEEQSSTNSIMLYDPKWKISGGTGFKEITEIPGIQRLKAITDDSSSALRYYFPKEHEGQISKMLC